MNRILNVEFDKEQTAILEIIDRKVTIREFKERGKMKTLVDGLQRYDEFKNKKKYDVFVKNLKVKLACGCNSDDDKLILHGVHKKSLSIILKEIIPDIVID